MNGIADLIDKSLLQQKEQENDEAYLVMLETIREYAQECLQRHGETEKVQLAYAKYYAAGFVEAAAVKLATGEQLQWLRRIDREYDNVRAALQWSVEHEEVEIAVRIGTGLLPYWNISGYLREGQQWMERILPLSRGCAVSLQARHFTVQVCWHGTWEYLTRWRRSLKKVWLCTGLWETNVVLALY